MFRKVLPPARRASLSCLSRRTFSRKAPSSTFDKLQQTVAETPPLCRRLGVNQQKVRHQIASSQLSVVPCKKQQAFSYGQAEERPQSLGKSAAVPLGQLDSLSKASRLKTGRSRKGESLKQRVGSHGDAKDDAQEHSANVTETTTNAKLSVLEVSSSDSGVCNEADASTFESMACNDHAKVQSSRNSEYTTCSQDLTGYESNVSTSPLGGSGLLTTMELGGKLPSSDCSVRLGINSSGTGAAFAKGNGDVVHGPSNSTDSFMPLQPLEDASINELPRKVKLAERLSPRDAASLLKSRTFKRCSIEQLENVVGVLEDCLPSSERVLRVLVRKPRVALHPADLLQQKLQVFANFQIEEEAIVRVVIQGGVLSMSAESLQERLAFLEELGLNGKAITKMFRWAPYAVGFAVEKFKRTRDFLIGKGATKEAIMCLVQFCPQVLWVSCDSNLIPRYDFFQQIGIPPPLLHRAVCFASRTAVNSLKANMKSLEDLGFSSDDVCSMLRKEPELLSYKIEKLKMTLDFLVHEQKYSMAYIVHYPKVLLYSLERRIIPRCKLMEKRGLSKVYSLATMLNVSDSRFEQLLSK